MKLLLLLTILTLGFVNSQHLTGQPSNPINYVEFGRSVTVSCIPQSTSGAINLKWFGPNDYFPGEGEENLIKDRNSMPRESDGSYSRVYSYASGNTLKLTIETVRDIDTGEYVCNGIVDNIQATWKFELQAYVGLTVTAPEEQFLVLNETTTIQCRVQSQPAPDIEWTFKDRKINAIADDRYEISANGLTVYHPTYADKGLYECKGIENTQGGTIVKKINVDVVTRPVMTTAPTNTTGKRWRDAQISCHASSTPAPQYKWYLGTRYSKGSTEVNSENLGTRFRPSETTGDLTIIDIQLEDEQWYWCEAYNKAGSVTGKSFFEVQMIPVFMDDNNINMTTSREGQTVEMTCQSEGKPPPKMSFQRWGHDKPYTNGIQANDSRIEIYEKSSAPQHENQLIIPREVVIKITDASPNDTANYTCISQNAAGRNQTNMHIIIQHKPKFDLMTEALNEQCIWQEHIRNVTVLLSGYPDPSLSWSKGDGSAITAKDSAFKMYLEPYWENGRPDEWMGNLEINWKVTSGGIDPINNIAIGNYYVRATNNLGTSEHTVVVVEGGLPERPQFVNFTETTSNTVTLYAEPPVEENCIKVIGFMIVYRIHTTVDLPKSALFTLAQRHNMKIDNLQPGSSYKFEVYAKNERGQGESPWSLVVDTKAATAPGVVEVTSESVSVSSSAHQVRWLEPNDGGDFITNYIISWREPGTSWKSSEIDNIRYYTIDGLEPATVYELKVQARNSRGLSADPSPLYTFRTKGKGDVAYRTETGDTKQPSVADDSIGVSDAVVTAGGLELHFIIIISVALLLILIVAIDMLCFCSRNFGVLACIYGSVSKDHTDMRDIIGMDGGEVTRSLTSVDEHGSTTDRKISRSRLNSSLASSYGETGTHGRDNRHGYTNEYDSRSAGENTRSHLTNSTGRINRSRDDLTNSNAADVKPANDDSQRHEYINTGRLGPTAVNSSNKEMGSRSTASRPMPQPRVPSTYNPTSASLATRAVEPDQYSVNSNQSNHSGQPLTREKNPNLYQPTAQRYQSHQPQQPRGGYQPSSSAAPMAAPRPHESSGPYNTQRSYNHEQPAERSRYDQSYPVTQPRAQSRYESAAPQTNQPQQMGRGNRPTLL